jgi:hypothetical protein
LFKDRVNKGSGLSNTHRIGNEEFVTEIFCSIGGFEAVDTFLAKDKLMNCHLSRGAVLIFHHDDMIKSLRTDAEHWDETEVGQVVVL